MTAASGYLSGKDVKIYYGDTHEPNVINVHTLADEMRRIVRTNLLNPRWIEGRVVPSWKDHLASTIMVMPTEEFFSFGVNPM